MMLLWEMPATTENGVLSKVPGSEICGDDSLIRRFDSIWTGKIKLSGYWVIVLVISTEMDDSPLLRLAEVVLSLFGQRKRKQSKKWKESCPVEAIVLA